MRRSALLIEVAARCNAEIHLVDGVVGSQD
jgi:hypothetical protein